MATTTLQMTTRTTHLSTRLASITISLLAGVGLTLGLTPQAAALEAQATFDAATGQVKVTYKGASVFEGTVSVAGVAGAAQGGNAGQGGSPAKAQAQARIEGDARPVKAVVFEYHHGPRDSGPAPHGEQAESLIVQLRPAGEGGQVQLEGAVLAGGDALACIPEGGPEMIRGCLGRSSSRLNRGIFDRQGDWVVRVDEPATCELKSAAVESGKQRFSLKASGDAVVLRFEERFYARHRGFVYWDPAKRLWTKPVCGWCSWAAYGADVTEQHMVDVAEFFAKHLKDYGYNLIQMDDGYQRFDQSNPAPLKPGESVAELWSVPNNKFPHGLAWLAGEISRRGLTPGIWLSSSLPLGLDPSWYLTDPDGKPHKGRWINYAVNGLNEKAVDAGFLGTIRELKKQGWSYFKIDTIRHLLYEAHGETPEYWAGRQESANDAFRQIYTAMKREIGPDIYMLSCWGAMPEMAGIPDGCRVGEDVGEGWTSASMSAHYASRFQYLNNVMWCNDPDYMCLGWPLTLMQARSWATFVAMLGGQLLVSDPPSAYDPPRVDIMRKVGPPLPIRPTTLRPLKTRPELWLLEVDGGESPYLVLARIAWDAAGLPARDISLTELGLDAGGTYLVWDFWNERFVGEFKDKLPLEMISSGDCRVYSIRPKLDRPQVVSTNRHIGQGATELRNVTWGDEKLSGELAVPNDRPFSVFIHVPDGLDADQITPATAKVVRAERILRLTLRSADEKPVQWSVKFAKGKK